MHPLFSGITITVTQATITQMLAITIKTGQFLPAIFLITTQALIMPQTTFLQGTAALLPTRKQQIPIQMQETTSLARITLQITIHQTTPIIIIQMRIHKMHRAPPIIYSAIKVAIRETTLPQITRLVTIQTTTIYSLTTPTTVLQVVTVNPVMFSNNIP